MRDEPSGFATLGLFVGGSVHGHQSFFFLRLEKWETKGDERNMDTPRMTLRY